MNKKLFYLDVETTGLDSKCNDILQLAYIVEINGKIKEKGSLFCQPFNYSNINTRALEINKLTMDEIKEFPTPQEMYSKLIKILDKYIDNYTRGHNKFSPAGYNVRFDVEFLREFFHKNNDRFYNSYFDYHLLSVDSLLYLFDYKGLIKLENYKLVTIAKHFGIEFNAHDALADIETTRRVFYKLLDYFRGSKK